MKSKNLMLLVLLIFVGQVVSTPFKTCATDNSKDSKHSTMMAEMQHHDMSTMNMQGPTSSTMSMDCCGDECQCPVDMCFSLAYLSDSQPLIMRQYSRNVVFQSYPSFQLSQNQDSLYRPPILS